MLNEVGWKKQNTRASNAVVSSTDSNFAAKNVGTKRSKQAVAEPILAGVEKIWARLDETNMKLRQRVGAGNREAWSQWFGEESRARSEGL